MPDWNRPRRVHNMRRVIRAGGGKPPKGCDFWLTTIVIGIGLLGTAAIIIAAVLGMDARR